MKLTTKMFSGALAVAVGVALAPLVAMPFAHAADPAAMATSMTTGMAPMAPSEISGTVLHHYVDAMGNLTAVDLQTAGGVQMVRWSPPIPMGDMRLNGLAKGHMATLTGVVSAGVATFSPDAGMKSSMAMHAQMMMDPGELSNRGMMEGKMHKHHHRWRHGDSDSDMTSNVAAPMAPVMPAAPSAIMALPAAPAAAYPFDISLEDLMNRVVGMNVTTATVPAGSIKALVTLKDGRVTVIRDAAGQSCFVNPDDGHLTAIEGDMTSVVLPAKFKDGHYARINMLSADGTMAMPDVTGNTR